MKHALVVLLLFGCIAALTPRAGAQDLLFVSGRTEVFISSGGRLVMDSPVTSRGMNRWAWVNLAESATNVYNFDDSVATIAAASVDSTTPGRRADYVLRHVASPAMGTLGTSRVGSTIHHIMSVYLWNDLKGAVVGYRLKNTGTTAVTGRLSFEFYPRIDQTYTGHYLRWSAADTTAWYFRPALAHAMGARPLSAYPAGVRLSTGATFYKPGITAAESQPDSVRHRLMNELTFTTAVDSPGALRSMIHMNAGTVTIAPGDSTAPLYYAVAYDTGQVSMQAAITALVARYRSRFPSGVEPSGGMVPEAFALEQNYPNPFNPGTRVDFHLPAGGATTLKVYNLLGQEVAVLVDGVLPAGSYTARFDAGSLPSGVYLYRLTSGGKEETRRMLLVR